MNKEFFKVRLENNGIQLKEKIIPEKYLLMNQFADITSASRMRISDYADEKNVTLLKNLFGYYASPLTEYNYIEALALTQRQEQAIHALRVVRSTRGQEVCMDFLYRLQSRTNWRHSYRCQ